MADLSIPEFNLAEVKVDELGRRTVSRLARAFGIAAQTRIERKIAKVANALVDDAILTMRKYSPVRTGELRDSFEIHHASTGVINFDLVAYVRVPNTPHETTRGRNKPTNSWLAHHLDAHPFISHGNPLTGTTKDWIQKGRAEFDSFVSTL